MGRKRMCPRCESENIDFPEDSSERKRCRDCGAHFHGTKLDDAAGPQQGPDGDQS